MWGIRVKYQARLAEGVAAHCLRLSTRNAAASGWPMAWLARRTVLLAVHIFFTRFATLPDLLNVVLAWNCRAQRAWRDTGLACSGYSAS